MKIVMESAYAVLKIYSGMERNVLNAICLPTMISASWNALPVMKMNIMI